MTTTRAIDVFVSGDPKGQPRPKAFVRGGHAAVYDPATAEGWKAEIALMLRPWAGKTPMVGPLHVRLAFLFKRPKSHYRTDGFSLTKSAPRDHVGKPDCDNLAKAVLDAITHLGLWEDDCQVTELSIGKRWARRGQAPGVHLIITERESAGAADAVPAPLVLIAPTPVVPDLPELPDLPDLPEMDDNDEARA